MSLWQVGHQSVTMMSTPSEIGGDREVEVDESESHRETAKSQVYDFC